MKRLCVAAALTVMTTAGFALALTYEGRTISRVDTQPNILIIQLNQNHGNTLPGSCNQHVSSMACNLNDPYCDMAGKIALAAQMAGKTVDYELSTTCEGIFVKFTRLRVNE